MWALIVELPAGDCDGYRNDAGLIGVALVVLTVASMLGCLAGAGYRIISLRSGPGISRGEILAVLGVIPVLAFFSLLANSWEADGELPFRIFLVGVCATAVTFLALVVASLAGRKPNDVHLLLPVYLFGAALFVFPGLGLLALFISSGIGC